MRMLRRQLQRTATRAAVGLSSSALLLALSTQVAAADPIYGNKCSSGPAGTLCARVYRNDAQTSVYAAGGADASPSHSICIVGVALYINGTRMEPYNQGTACSDSRNNYQPNSASTSFNSAPCRYDDVPGGVTRTYTAHVTYRVDSGAAETLVSNDAALYCAR